MKHRLFVTLAVLILALAPLGVAYAITYGTPDEGEHPYVGLLAFYDANDEFIWRCSGSLVTDRFVVTAGHCVGADAEGVAPAYARLYLDETIIYDPVLDDYTNPVYYLGLPVPHPEFNWSLWPVTHDIGAVVMIEPVPALDEYAVLPPVNIMDEVSQKGAKRDVILTPVGYGVNDYTPPTKQVSLRTRYMAQSFLISLDNAMTEGWNIMMSNNPGQWTGSEDYVSGGTCFGDSGGPVHLGGPESNTIVGVNSFVINPYCTGTDGAYRVDLQDSLDFLHQVATEYGLELP